MRKAILTTCILCGLETVATNDDFTPMCEECTEWWAIVESVGAIMRGEIALPEEEEGGDRE